MHLASQFLGKRIETLRADYDLTIAIDGRKRRGKSTLAYHISEIAKSLLGSRVHLCYVYPELREALFDSEKYDVIIADESIEFLFKGDWNSWEAKDYLKLFDRVGFKNLLQILIMPNFWDMNKSFRNSRVDIWVHVSRRGWAEYHVPVRSKYDPTPFWNHLFNDDFPPMPLDVEEEYREIKEKSFEERETMHDNRARIWYELAQRGLPQKEIAEIFGVGKATVSRHIRNYKELI
jgi:hypothetical protein